MPVFNAEISARILLALGGKRNAKLRLIATDAAIWQQAVEVGIGKSHCIEMLHKVTAIVDRTATEVGA